MTARKKRDLLKEATFLTELPADRPLVVLVTGPRDWDDAEPIRAQIARLTPGSKIIHGAAKGVDSLAGAAAREFGLEEIACPTNWRLGRGAAMIRNRQMLDDHHPDIVLAVHPCLAQAKGTRHMVEYALKNMVPVCLVGALRLPGEPPA